MTKINFKDPNNRISGEERRSKLLDPSSELYKWVDNKFKDLVAKYGEQVGSKRMDYHIELLKRNDNTSDGKLLVERCQQLENKDVDVTNVGQLGRAYVLHTGKVDGYGETHVSIAFFPKGVPSELLI